MRNIKTIHLDLDGVVADFDGYIKKVTGKTCEELNAGCEINQVHSNDDRTDPVFRVMREHIENNNLFSNLEPLDHQEWINLVRAVRERGFRVEFLSAAPSHGLLEKSANQKIEWIKKYNFEYDDIIILPSASLKQKYARSTSLLIDDYEKNVKGYVLSGGLAIHHRSFEETRNRLEFYVGELCVA